MTAPQFKHHKPSIRVEALVLEGTRNGGKSVLTLQENSNGHLSLPGGNVATNESPVEALRKRLYHQLGIEAYLISEERLVAVDSEIRDGYPQTRLILVYHIVPTWTLDNFIAKTHSDWSAKVMPGREVEIMFRDANPGLARRYQHAFDVARYGRATAAMLRNGHAA